MKTLTIFWIVMLVTGCQAQNLPPSLPGHYSVRNKNLSDRIFLRQQQAGSRIIGSSLVLEADSTFQYQTCGNNMSGRWRAQQDSLLLTVLTNHYRSDSMAKTPAPLPLTPLVFIIRNRQLYRFWEAGNEHNTIELLTKTN